MYTVSRKSTPALGNLVKLQVNGEDGVIFIDPINAVTAAMEERRQWYKVVSGKIKYEVVDKNGLFLFETCLTKKVIAWAVSERNRLPKCCRCYSVCGETIFKSGMGWDAKFCSILCVKKYQDEIFAVVDNEETEFEI